MTTVIAEMKALQDGFRPADQVAPPAGRPPDRRIGAYRRRKTLPFNGYADDVASLYAGMDLKKFF